MSESTRYPETPLSPEDVRDVLRELNYVYPVSFCKTLAGKLNDRIASKSAVEDSSDDQA